MGSCGVTFNLVLVDERGPLGNPGLCSIGMAAPYAWIAWFLTGPTSAILRVSLSWRLVGHDKNCDH